MVHYSKTQRKESRWRSWWLAGWLLLLGPPLALAQGSAPAPPAGAPLPLPQAVPLAGPLALGFRLVGTGPVKHSDFPDIEGFRKGNVVRATTTRLLPGGQRRTEQTVTQRYYPYTEGNYVIPAFDLAVNGQLLHSPAGQVHVGAPVAASATPTAPAATGSLDQLLGRPKPQYFYEPPDHAYLALEADQPTVFVGQGVRVALSLYLQPADQALLSFYDFTRQLESLRQQLRQPTTWQTTPADPAVLPDTVRRPGQPLLLRFRLADYTYYPLTPKALRFPALELTLTKFKLLKKPQPGDNERLAFYKIYHAEPVRVAVRPLPGNPGPVAVGELTLTESLSQPRPQVNEAFTYTFGVEGAGNSATVAPTELPASEALAVYGPEVREEVIAPGRWRKTFRYRLVARRPGPVPLPRLLQLPYFNPVLARYDTLQPSVQPVAYGTAQRPAARPSDDAFYGPALARADARLQPLDVYRQVSRYATWLLAGLLVVAAAGAWWGRSS